MGVIISICWNLRGLEVLSKHTAFNICASTGTASISGYEAKAAEDVSSDLLRHSLSYFLSLFATAATVPRRGLEHFTLMQSPTTTKQKIPNQSGVTVLSFGEVYEESVKDLN